MTSMGSFTCPGCCEPVEVKCTVAPDKRILRPRPAARIVLIFGVHEAVDGHLPYCTALPRARRLRLRTWRLVAAGWVRLKDFFDQPLWIAGLITAAEIAAIVWWRW